MSFRKLVGKEVSGNGTYINAGILQTALNRGWVLTLCINYLSIAHLVITVHGLVDFLPLFYYKTLKSFTVS